MKKAAPRTSRTSVSADVAPGYQLMARSEQSLLQHRRAAALRSHIHGRCVGSTRKYTDEAIRESGVNGSPGDTLITALEHPPKKDPAYTIDGAVGSMTSADISPLPRLVPPQ